jgi:hypothetical protein
MDLPSAPLSHAFNLAPGQRTQQAEGQKAGDGSAHHEAHRPQGRLGDFVVLVAIAFGELFLPIAVYGIPEKSISV